jgi:hypothetical protein
MARMRTQYFWDGWLFSEPKKFSQSLSLQSFFTAKFAAMYRYLTAACSFEKIIFFKNSNLENLLNWHAHCIVLGTSLDCEFISRHPGPDHLLIRDSHDERHYQQNDR